MKIDNADIQPSTPLEECMVELDRANVYIHMRLWPFLDNPDGYNTERLQGALGRYARATREVRRAIESRRLVDEGLGRIAQAAQEHREGEGNR